MAPNESPSIWTSCRLVFALCAFLFLVCQLCMRNVLGFAILCMVKNNCSSSNSSECASKLDYEGDLDWTRWQEFLALSAYFYGYLWTQAVGGSLADKYGGKIFFTYGMAAQSLLFMLIPVSARVHFWVFFVVRVIQGAVAGISQPAIYTLFAKWAHPIERTALMTFTYSGFTIGALINTPICSGLCKLGWIWVFYVMGGVSLFFSVVSYWLIYDGIDSHPRIAKDEFDFLSEGGTSKVEAPPIPWKAIAKSCPVYTFIVCHCCNSFGLTVIILTLSRFLKESLMFGIVANGFLSSTPFVGSLISRIIVILLFNRLRAKSPFSLTIFRRIVYCGGNAFTVLFFFAIYFLSTDYRYIIVLFIFLIGISGDISFSAGYWVTYLDIAPAFAGLLSGISNTFSTLSGVVAPKMTNAIVTEGTKDQWDWLFLIVIAFYFIGLVVYAFFGSSEPEPWGQFVAKEEKDKK